MIGYPKHLNTKEDYEYVKDNFPAEEWKPYYQELLDTQKDWFPIGEVEESNGITDDTHKIVEEKDLTNKTTKYIQYELQDNPNCLLLRLGFTAEEVKAAVVAEEGGR